MKTCARADCGTSFEAQRSTRRYCSQACQKRDRRAEPTPERQVRVDHAAVLPTAVPDDDDGTLAWITIRELRRARRLDTPRGRLTVKAARIIDASTAVMGMSALMLTFDRELAAAVDGVQVEVDPLDELQERRDAKVAQQ